jgi:hypothetical protein
MNSHKKYLVVFFVLLTLLAGVIVAFNRIVDPFWYYRDTSTVGFNAIKAHFNLYERYVKPSIVQRDQPSSLIFGSSFSEMGFDPQHPALRAAGAGYNAGLAGASWHKVECNVRFALVQDKKLRQMIVGIHPEAMPRHSCAEELYTMAHPDQLAFLFSMDALRSSLDTVIQQNTLKTKYRPDGVYLHARGQLGLETIFRSYYAKYAQCNASTKTDKIDLDGLRDLIQLAVARGITLKLVVYPRHAMTVEHEFHCGLRQQRWQKLRQIAEMVDAMGYPQLVQLWSFEGYNDITTESITSGSAIYWQDPGHFNYEFGNAMLDEMFAIKPPSYGVHLTEKVAEQQAAMEVHTRQAWLATHPEFIRQRAAFFPWAK